MCGSRGISSVFLGWTVNFPDRLVYGGNRDVGGVEAVTYQFWVRMGYGISSETNYPPTLSLCAKPDGTVYLFSKTDANTRAHEYLRGFYDRSVNQEDTTLYFSKGNLVGIVVPIL